MPLIDLIPFSGKVKFELCFMGDSFWMFCTLLLCCIFVDVILIFLSAVAFCLQGTAADISQQSAFKPWQLCNESAGTCL